MVILTNDYVVLPAFITTSLSPSRGFYRQNTTVTVTGRNFTSDDPKCYVHGVASAATVISDSQMVCIAPAVNSPMNVSVQVTDRCTNISLPLDFNYYGMILTERGFGIC